MAKVAMVQCRICKERFNRLNPNLLEGVDWIKPSNRVYYHKKCYDEYQKSRLDVHANMTDEMWFDACWDLLRRDLKYSFNYVKVRKQWESFIKNKMTAKGMYFALKYHYEIKKGDVTKSENGIGIIPHIYEDSRTYWTEREERTAGIVAAIEAQIKEAAKQKTVKVNLKQTKKPTKSAADMLAAIGDMEEDE
jgi:hypothetical protein